MVSGVVHHRSLLVMSSQPTAHSSVVGRESASVLGTPVTSASWPAAVTDALDAASRTASDRRRGTTVATAEPACWSVSVTLSHDNQD